MGGRLGYIGQRLVKAVFVIRFLLVSVSFRLLLRGLISMSKTPQSAVICLTRPPSRQLTWRQTAFHHFE